MKKCTCQYEPQNGHSLDCPLHEDKPFKGEPKLDQITEEEINALCNSCFEGEHEKCEDGGCVCRCKKREPKLNDVVKSMEKDLEPKLEEEWIKDFRDFYMESGKYEGRKLGIDGYIDFIRLTLAQQKKNLRKNLVRELPKEKLFEGSVSTRTEMLGFNNCLSQIKNLLLKVI